MTLVAPYADDAEMGMTVGSNSRFRMIAGIGDLSKILKELIRDLDVVYVFKPCLGSGPCGFGIATIKRVPVLLDVDDYVSSGSLIEKLLFKDLLVRALPIMARTIVVASRELQRIYGAIIRTEKVHYIPNSADLNIFDRSKIKSTSRNSPTFVWCGSIDSSGPCELMIRAFDKMRNDSTLIIVGDGIAKPDVVRLVERLGISKSVKFTGRLGRAMVPRILAASDVGLIPLRNTIHDRCKSPVKLFEYMAMELPTISVDYGEAAYVIRKAGCGLTSAANPESFALAMDQIAENLGFWQQTGKIGRRYLVEQQNWELLSKDLEAVLGNTIRARC
jgi:glycosyltransferase involved in cell wall biosynthesis